MVQRQTQHHGAQVNAGRVLREGSEIDGLRRRHVERRQVVLGDVIAIEAELFGQANELIPFLELLLNRNVAPALEVIPPAEFKSHGPFLLVAGADGSRRYGVLAVTPIDEQAEQEEGKNNATHNE